MAEKRRVGRPSSKTDARKKLIVHARDLFVVMAYDKVSTRLIAQKAGVNSALIRYYFGSKEGLFETMLRETLAPMQKKMQQLVMESTERNLLDIMKIYYREMVKMPQFPRLIVQVMHMPPSDIQRRLVEKVFLDITQPMQEMLFGKLASSGVINPERDPQLCRISYISLMVFPFIAPPALLAVHGVEMNETFFDRLVEHNIQVMKSGFLRPELATAL